MYGTHDLQGFVFNDNSKLEEHFDLFFEDEIMKSLMLNGDKTLILSAENISILDKNQNMILKKAFTQGLKDVTLYDQGDTNLKLLLVTLENELYLHEIEWNDGGGTDEELDMIAKLETNLHSIFFSPSMQCIYLSYDGFILEATVPPSGNDLQLDRKKFKHVSILIRAA